MPDCFFKKMFWPRSMWDPSSPTRARTHTLDLNHGALTTGLPEKSPQLTFQAICACLTFHIVKSQSSWTQ